MTMKATLRVFGLMIAAGVGGVGVAWASCALQGPICFAYENAAVVFVGNVVSMKPASGPTRSGVVTQVQFSAIERLKGDVATDGILRLEPSSEEFAYVVGQRVLVYASRRGTAWSTACTRTRVVSPPAIEVAALRSLRDKRKGGFINADVATIELDRARRLRDIRVTITRRGAVTADVSTDMNGRFITPWLDPGTYVLSVNDPSRQLAARREVAILDGSACVALGSILAPPKLE